MLERNAEMNWASFQGTYNYFNLDNHPITVVISFFLFHFSIHIFYCLNSIDKPPLRSKPVQLK